uniref:Glycosyl transferase n=1 Tax=Anisakis simplex TaxID=6269 RepID=A0A0M3JJW5_ANISI
LWNYFVAHPDEVKYGVVDTLEYMSSAMAYWNSEDDIDEVLFIRRLHLRFVLSFYRGVGSDRWPHLFKTLKKI